MSWARLRRLVTTHFDIEELRTICFDLGMDYDDLRGEGKSAKVRELIAQLRREDRIPELISILMEVRPGMAWDELGAAGRAAAHVGPGRRNLWLVAGIVVVLVGAMVVSRVVFHGGIAPSTPELPSPTVRLTETATPTLTPSQTPAATPTPTPSPSNTPTATPSCPAVSGPFGAVWNSVQGEVGCAVGEAIAGQIVEENFEGGKMFWREPVDYAQALVLFNDGTWRVFKHSPYVEGSPEFSCTDADTPPRCPPTPKRGFGMMWCDIPEIRGGLGDALDCERGYQGAMQQFGQGFMLQTDNGAVYVFYSGGRWERR